MLNPERSDLKEQITDDDLEFIAAAISSESKYQELLNLLWGILRDLKKEISKLLLR